MAKETISIRVDHNLIQKARMLNINRTEIFEKALQAIIGSNLPPNEARYFEICEEIEKVQENIGELQHQHQNLVNQKIAWEQKQRTEIQTELKEVETMQKIFHASGIMEDIG